jgi:hypothetical protein
VEICYTINALIYGTSWGIKRFVWAFLYWHALVLVENNELPMKNSTM